MNAGRARKTAPLPPFEIPESPALTGSESDEEIPFWPEEDDDNHEQLEEAEMESLVLRWVPEARIRARKPHLGVSRFTKWRRKSEMEKRARAMAGNKTLFDFWNIDPEVRKDNNQEPENNLDFSDDEESSDAEMLKALELIEGKLKIHESNRHRESLMKSITKTDFLRLLSVHRYLKSLLDGEPRVSSSQEVAASFYPSRKREWTARQIRIWTEIFLITHSLPEKNQGRHVKIKSIISDENTQAFCRQWLRSQKPHAISGKSFAEWTRRHLHHEIGLPAAVEINERTATRWLHVLNYNLGDSSRKGTYFDGHERADVVEYRKMFLLRMEGYQRRMPIYVGDEMETRIMAEPSSNTKPLIFVVHDDSCFQSNDGGKTGWFDDNHRQIRPKGSGKSLMVSAFLCECHGLLRLPNDGSGQCCTVDSDCTKIIRPGSNGEGYWTNSDLVEQTRKAMTIFKFLHPDCDALFVFDNSANHHGFAPDALVASRLNLKRWREEHQIHHAGRLVSR